MVKIIKATYGAGKKKKNVTAIFQKYVDQRRLKELSQSYNRAFGDPAQGTVKVLVVEYERGGRRWTSRFGENSPICLRTVVEKK